MRGRGWFKQPVRARFCRVSSRDRESLSVFFIYSQSIDNLNGREQWVSADAIQDQMASKAVSVTFHKQHASYQHVFTITRQFLGLTVRGKAKVLLKRGNMIPAEEIHGWEVMIGVCSVTDFRHY